MRVNNFFSIRKISAIYIAYLMSSFRRAVYRPFIRPVYRAAVRPVTNIARRTVNRTVRGIANTNPVTAALVAEYEAELRKERRKTAARKATAKGAPSNSQMEEASSYRKMSSAPVTVGMTIKRPPISAREMGTYDSKIVSATEVIFSSVTSTNNSYTGGAPQLEIYLNPLNPAFKILADEAKNFQLFRFTKANMVFESTCNSTVGGSIVLGQLTDVLDAPPTTYEDAVLLKDSIQANVWQSVSLPLSLDMDFRYVTEAESASGAEIRQSNQALLFYGLVNTAIASGAVGNIKLDYSVELCKRVNGTELTSFDQFVYSAPAPGALLAAMANILPSAKTSTWFKKDLINQRLIIRPKATYIVNLTITSQADEDIVSAGATVAPYDSSGSIPTLSTWAYGSWNPKTNVNQNIYSVMYDFKSTEMDCYIDFSGLTGLTGPLDVNLTIDILT